MAEPQPKMPVSNDGFENEICGGGGGGTKEIFNICLTRWGSHFWMRQNYLLSNFQ